MLVVLAALLVPASLHAQRLPPVPSYSSSTFQLDTTHTAIPKTYWLEGGIIGGVGVGVLTVLWVNGADESKATVAGNAAGFVLGAIVGFPAGALIGGQFHKHR